MFFADECRGVVGGRPQGGQAGCGKVRTSSFTDAGHEGVGAGAAGLVGEMRRRGGGAGGRCGKGGGGWVRSSRLSGISGSLGVSVGRANASWGCGVASADGVLAATVSEERRASRASWRVDRRSMRLWRAERSADKARSMACRGGQDADCAAESCESRRGMSAVGDIARAGGDGCVRE